MMCAYIVNRAVTRHGAGQELAISNTFTLSLSPHSDSQTRGHCGLIGAYSPFQLANQFR